MTEFFGFTPGPGTAFVRPGLTLLVGPDHSVETHDLWARFRRGAAVDDLLDVLLADGIRSAGDVAIAELESRGTRILLSGAGVAAVWGDEGSVELDAVGVRTLTERIVTDVTGGWIGLVAAGSPTHWVERGMVPAGRVFFGAPSGSDATTVGAADTEVGVPRSEPEPAAEGPEPAADPVDQGASPPDDAPVAQHGEADGSPSTLPRERTEARSTGHAVPEAAQVVDEAAEQPGFDADDYDYDALYGHTVAKSIQGAARQIEDPDGDGSPSGDPAPPPDGISGTIPRQSLSRRSDPSAAVPPPEEAIIPTSGLIAGIPGAAPAGAESAGAVEGATISIAQLRQMRAAGAAPPPTATDAPPGGVYVTAIRCQGGHSNPQHRSACVACGALLDGPVVEVPRPRLGTIVLSTGETVHLDRPAVLGRKPKMEGQMANEVPRLVEVAGHEVSRMHVAVRLEGWQVLLEDLDSANGTVLTLPGRAPQRLRAGEPVPLETGAEFVLGGEVSARVELVV